MNALELEAVPAGLLVSHIVVFLLGFIAWRIVELCELSGARMRHRRAVGEVKAATAEQLEHARELRTYSLVCRADESQRERARIGRELGDAAGTGSDPSRDWLGRKPVDHPKP